MQRAALVMALPLLLGLAACRDTPQCETFPADLHSPAGMLLMDRPEKLTVLADVGRAGDCEGVTDPAVSSVYVEIFDPDQQPVVHESSLAPLDAPGASIWFTPTKLGRYHFFVAFDPIANVQQFDLLSVRDRSTEPPVQTLPLMCNALERTRSGTWLCDASVFRGQTFVQNLPGLRVAVIGDIVWVASGTQLLRYRDDGTELQLTATLTLRFGLPEYIQATEDEAVLLLASSIQRVTFNGTELSSASPTSWNRQSTGGPIGDQGPQGIIFRSGEGLAIIHNAPSIEGPRVHSCAYALSGGFYVRTPQPCQAIDGVVVGFEPSVLWIADQTAPGPSLTVLQRLELTETGFVPTATLSVPPTLTLTFPRLFHRASALPVLTPNVRNGAPLLRAAVPVYLPEQSLLRLEHLDEEVSSPQSSASYFWGNTAQNGGTSMGVRIRAVAPVP